MMGIFLPICFLLNLPAIAFAGQSSYLPPPVQNQKKPVEEKFHKFWRKRVLEDLIHYDYDAWFRRFMNFPTNLMDTVGSKFSCPSIVHHALPTSVHRLTPTDVSIIAALGGSATSGFGARSSNLDSLFADYRGIAWSIGGDGSVEQVLTLPNIFKKYNPDIAGYSTKVTKVSDGKKRFSGNNFAKTGSTVEGLPENVEELISHMKKKGELRMKSEWKVLTIFIGEQDLCMSCFDKDYAAGHFIKKVSKALEKIKEKLPRVFVNLIQVYDVTKLYKISSSYCRAFLKVTCPCVAAGRRQRAHVSRNSKEYSRQLRNLVHSPKFRDTQDFAVVLQPFLADSILPKQSNGTVDRSYFAPDCFHLSAKGQAAMAKALWNNMLEPVGKKTTSMTVDDRLKCPRPNFPFLFTKTNSKEYRLNNGPILKSHPDYHGHPLYKSSQREEQDWNESGHKGQVHHKSLGIAIGTGLGVVAMAVGITVFMVKRRSRERVDHFAQDHQPNYNSCDRETLL